MNLEMYKDLRGKIAAELADDWSPHVAIISHINRAIERKEVSEVAGETLTLLKRLMDDGIVVAGELDPNLDFSFARYEGTQDEVWLRVERQIPIGHRVRYEQRFWFDGCADTFIADAKSA